MAEEKKENEAPQGKEAAQEAKPKVEAAPAAPAAAPAEAPKAETPQAAPAAAPAKAEEKKEAPKKEKPANCSGCNKSIKKKRWYYRDGKYFCTKRCWTTTKKKQEKPQEEPAK